MQKWFYSQNWREKKVCHIGSKITSSAEFPQLSKKVWPTQAGKPVWSNVDVCRLVILSYLVQPTQNPKSLFDVWNDLWRGVAVPGKAASSWVTAIRRRSKDDSDEHGIPRLSKMGHIRPRSLRPLWPGWPVTFFDKEKIPPQAFYTLPMWYTCFLRTLPISPKLTMCHRNDRNAGHKMTQPGTSGASSSDSLTVDSEHPRLWGTASFVWLTFIPCLVAIARLLRFPNVFHPIIQSIGDTLDQTKIIQSITNWPVKRERDTWACCFELRLFAKQEAINCEPTLGRLKCGKLIFNLNVF